MHVEVGQARQLMERINDQLDDRSVIVVEGLWRDKSVWQQLIADNRVRISFDLYYCGIMLFDSHRTKKNYIINF